MPDDKDMSTEAILSRLAAVRLDLADGLKQKLLESDSPFTPSECLPLERIARILVRKGRIIRRRELERVESSDEDRSMLNRWRHIFSLRS